MALHEEWAENPPTHVVVAAAYLKKKEKVMGDPADLLNQQNLRNGV